MQWVLVFHVVFVVCWFAGLFYLPRLFVYHAEARDVISIERFKVMERKLYRGIMMPSGILGTFFGVWYLWVNLHYLSLRWMQAKIILVVLLWIYHLFCWKYLIDFRKNKNLNSHKFYRFFNEIPVVLLILIIILAIIKPL